MIDSLLNSPVTRMLEQTLSFTEQRHEVLLTDLANGSTPGFVQQDLPVEEFQSALRKAIGKSNAGGEYEPESSEDIAFEPGGSGVRVQGLEKPTGVAYHDRGVREAEYLESQIADNAMAHNMTAQFLKNRYDLMAKAISLKA